MGIVIGKMLLATLVHSVSKSQAGSIKRLSKVMYPHTRDVGELISSNHAKSKEENRKYLLSMQDKGYHFVEMVMRLIVILSNFYCSVELMIQRF